MTPDVVLAAQDKLTTCVPVPESEMVVGEPVALLATFTCAPLTGPPLVGPNVTVSVVVCCGISTVPAETPLVLKPAPVVLTEEMVTFELPLFVRVTV